MKWPWRKSPSSESTPINWQQAFAIPILAGFSATGQQQLVTLAQRFLASRQLTALHGLTLTADERARIALLFCLPVAELGLEWLDGIYEVLIYPEPFVVDDEWEDEFGLVHRERVVQSGQSWQQGPVILNWLDIQDSWDTGGFNLVIHEVAHKLDMRSSGIANGIPNIPHQEVTGFESALQEAMENIRDEVDAVGEARASIDAYAGHDPAECFAVLSEYFFSAPSLLAARFPTLWSYFCGFYRQNPLCRLSE